MIKRKVKPNSYYASVQVVIPHYYDEIKLLQEKA